ncbi:uracil-DNA glycosylase [Buchnera aphidicola (Ceratovacuna keduensis)]|uniref:uracil-DNA glycosylase n=1 Tax=Buchnera aphidicola TaxID=9 RepID=UPI0031B83F35
MKKIITWKNILDKKKKKYLYEILNFIRLERLNKVIYPSDKNIFSAFKYTSFKNIKIVMLGQDPYYKNGQANGLSFSVNYGIKIPPSLNNIFKELKSSIKYFNIPKHGNLLKWANQGILLLNTILTVEENKPNSHKDIGWTHFTDTIIEKISFYKKNVIFLLLGKNAQKKIDLINFKKHFILISSHPSPYSSNNGFLGCNHFLKINSILSYIKKDKIDWNL